MSGSGAAYSASIAAWPSAQVVAARNRGQTVLRYAAVCVADAAQGLPAGDDSAALPLRLAR